MNIFKINNNGFSIIEVSVALGVISIGILGVFSLVLQSIQAQNASKSVLVASMLAQEGIELVRNMRDENWISNPVVAWDLDINGYTNDDFTIDYMINLADVDNGNLVDNIIEENGTKLYFTDGSNFYTHDSTAPNKPTMYSRLITAKEIDASSPPDGVTDYYAVSSHVQWLEKDVLKNYIAETRLYNWR